MSTFELLSSEHFHVILHPNKKNALIINRVDQSISTLNYNDAIELCNLSKIGHYYGIVGIFLNRYLILIRSRTHIGHLYEPSTQTEHDVYVITQVQAIDIHLSPQSIKNVAQNESVRYISKVSEKCDSNKEALVIGSRIQPSDHYDSLPANISTSSYISNQARGVHWNPFKLQIPFRNKRQLSDPCSSNQATNADDRQADDTTNENISDVNNQDDERLVDETVKLFNGTNSFYYSYSLDLTNRFSKGASLVLDQDDSPKWDTANDNFFWNKHMMKEFIETSKSDKVVNTFTCIVLQGFISIKDIEVASSNSSDIEDGVLASELNSGRGAGEQLRFTNRSNKDYYKIALVSRRSVYRAGTRYRRRGCDEDGYCANFVETEQIFRHSRHMTSFITVRGSIPLYWYQSGANYRPPPVLYRTEEENHQVLSKHFNQLVNMYETENILVVDCTEHNGREKFIHDAYKRHITNLEQSNGKIKLIEFDFHRHCRGRQCSDAQIERHLKGCGLDEQQLKDIRYYWNDGAVIWQQNSIVRVNCLDCTDRTNVVQRSIALQILDIQLARLGVITPDGDHEKNACRKEVQQMWSANGNVLSTQYCGTRALFSGDKKLAGYLQDTYNSASRYYISKFRDADRQAAIDAMLGIQNGNETNLQQRPSLDGLDLVEPAVSRRVALLKDVGSRVTSRLARLKGSFNVRTADWYNENMKEIYTNPNVMESNIDMTDAKIADTLNGLDIDWPSSESLTVGGDNVVIVDEEGEDDCFQDDDFSQLMLSIDLDELKRLQDNEGKSTNDKDKELVEQNEEIDMVETCAVKRTSDAKISSTSTTST